MFGGSMGEVRKQRAFNGSVFSGVTESWTTLQTAVNHVRRTKVEQLLRKYQLFYELETCPSLAAVSNV